MDDHANIPQGKTQMPNLYLSKLSTFPLIIEAMHVEAQSRYEVLRQSAMIFVQTIHYIIQR